MHSTSSLRLLSIRSIRYKLVSKKTFPKFSGGGDREATQAIISEQRVQDDVQFGKTKIFIRTPQTVFALEHKREEKLPDICLTLQTVSNFLAVWF